MSEAFARSTEKGLFVKSNKKAVALALGVGLALAIPIAGAVAPAAAATKCTNVYYDSSSGIASADCTGNGTMRFVVSCDAIWPFTPWTKYSQWITITGGGLDAAHQFPSCDAPSSVSVQY